MEGEFKMEKQIDQVGKIKRKVDDDIMDDEVMEGEKKIMKEVLKVNGMSIELKKEYMIEEMEKDVEDNFEEYMEEIEKEGEIIEDIEVEEIIGRMKEEKRIGQIEGIEERNIND